MDTAIGTFQADEEAAFTPTLGEVKPIDIFSLERRKTDQDTVADLVEDLARDRRFLHPIAVRDEGGTGYRLISGHQRLEAWKRHFGERQPIQAVIFPSHMPDARITLLDTGEDLHRKDLTPAERQARLLRYAAARKELERGKPVTPVSDSGQGPKSGTASPSLAPARGGRGNKGMAQKIAGELGIGKRSVNRIAKEAAEAIGEKIDLDRDTPEELQRKADKRLHTEPKAKRPKHRERAPQEVVDDSGEIDSEIEEVWRAFSALSERKQLKILLRACRLRGWALRMGRSCRVPAVDEEPAVALPFKAAPATYDTAVDSQPEQQEGGADVSADDLQHPGDAVSQAADQEPELAVDLPAKVGPATDDAAVNPQPEQPDAAADLAAEDLQVADDDGSDDAAAGVAKAADQEEDPGAEDLENAGDAVPEAANQEPGGAVKCAYCTMPFEGGDECVMIYGRPYHADLCAKFAKPPIAIAA